MAESFYMYNTRMDYIRSCQSLDVKFSQQPPEDLRKSNFFNFAIQLKVNSQPVHVEDARWIQFLHENAEDTRNGMKYSLRLRYPNGQIEDKSLYLTLVDASTFAPVRFEGDAEDSRRKQRVLLTHESICSRCIQRKSCGNKSEAPADPRILQAGGLQFFMKCNQNCLKVAGNPRDMRRFALAVSFEDITPEGKRESIVALSDKIFVHNNSKHSKKRKKDIDIKVEPRVPEPTTLDLVEALVYPKVGTVASSFSFTSSKWSHPGVTFMCNNHVQFPVTSVIPNAAMTVQLPPRLTTPGTYFITMLSHNRPVFYFSYSILERTYDPRREKGFLILYTRDYQKIEDKIIRGEDDILMPVMEGTAPSQNNCRYSNPPYPLSFGQYNCGPLSPSYSNSSVSSVDREHCPSDDSPPNYVYYTRYCSN